MTEFSYYRDSRLGQLRVKTNLEQPELPQNMSYRLRLHFFIRTLITRFKEVINNYD